MSGFLAAAAFGAQCLIPRRAPRVTTTACAAGLAAAAGAFGLAALAPYFSRGTSPDPVRVDKANRLITDGANALSRNPMYLALAVGLVAHAVFRRRWEALVPAAGFVAAADRFQIPREERALAAAFGADYDRYRRRVRRWL